MRKGFTLIELLIVIAIIAIIAAVAFVALDPLTRFRDARDSSRWADANGLLSAIKVDMVDNGGSLLSGIVQDGLIYMIGTASSGCDDASVANECDVDVDSDTACIDLTGLVYEGYIGEIPIAPQNPDTTVEWDATLTGYTMMASSTGIIAIQACDSEGDVTEIKVSR